MRILPALILPAALLLSACASTSEPDEQRAEASLLRASPPLAIAIPWAGQLSPAGIDRYNRGQPRARDGKLYLATPDGQLARYRLADGQLEWRQQFPTRFSGGPEIHGDTLLLGSLDALVMAVDANDGRLKWQTRVSSEVLAPPKLAGDRVIVQTGDGKIFGLRADNGRQVWSYDRRVPLLTLRGTSEPLIVADQVIAGFANGKLVALALDDGKLLWEASIAVPKGRSELERMIDIDGAMVWRDGIVYAASYQGRLAALDADTGRIMWTREMSTPLDIALASEHLFLTDAEGRVWALDRATGATIWRQEKLAGFAITAPALDGKRLLIGDKAGNIHVLAQDDGRLLGHIEGEHVLQHSGVESLLDQLDEPAYLTNFWDYPRAVARAPQATGQGVLLAYQNGAVALVVEQTDAP